MTTAHIRLKKADGSFQYDSDLGTAYYRSAAVIQTQPRFRSNTSASTAYVPININDDSLIAVWAYGGFARGGSVNINGQWYELYQTNMPVGANFYYWVMGKATELPATGMVRTKNAQGQITFTSAKPPMVGIGIVGGSNASPSIPYDSQRQYGVVMPAFAGHSIVTYDQNPQTDYEQKPPQQYYEGSVDGKLHGLRWTGSAFEQVDVSWNDINVRSGTQQPVQRTEYNIPFQGGLVVDMTATGQLAIGEPPPPAAVVAFDPAPVAHSSNDGAWNFGGQKVIVTGGASPITNYTWSLENASGGDWSFSRSGNTASIGVVNVVGQVTATATLRCTVTMANGQTATGTATFTHTNTASEGSNVTVSLAGQNGSGKPSSYNFGAASPAVSGGTPSSYNWSVAADNGSWSIASGQGTSSAGVRITGAGIAGETYSATVSCSMVINGTTYVASAAFTYYNTG